nr:MAG TPA: hypothetical protein [Caudoviricetes sp.]
MRTCKRVESAKALLFFFQILKIPGGKFQKTVPHILQVL